MLRPRLVKLLMKDRDNSLKASIRKDFIKRNTKEQQTSEQQGNPEQII